MVKTLLVAAAMSVVVLTAPSAPHHYTPKPYHCCKHLDPNMHPPAPVPEASPGSLGPDGFMPPDWTDQYGRLTPQAQAALHLPPLGMR